jgi:coenzyme F420-reducing hydrogenase beta subunit
LVFYQDQELIRGTTGYNYGLWNRIKKWLKNETVYKEIRRIIAISTPCFIDLFTLRLYCKEEFARPDYIMMIILGIAGFITIIKEAYLKTKEN